jgi:hypothetical protein
MAVVIKSGWDILKGWPDAGTGQWWNAVGTQLVDCPRQPEGGPISKE